MSKYRLTLLLINIMLISLCLKAYRYDYMLNFNERSLSYKTFFQGHHTQKLISLTSSVIDVSYLQF